MATENSNPNESTNDFSENTPRNEHQYYGPNIYNPNKFYDYYGIPGPYGRNIAYGSTDTSGSALFPGYQSTVYEKIHIHEAFAPKDQTEKEEYESTIRQIYLDELINSSEAAQNDRKRLENYGKWVFAISIGMTFLGVLFSIVQFYFAVRFGDFSSLATEFRIENPASFVITTSAIGAFVLTISLVFFFLFLKYVYKPDKKGTTLFPHIKGARDLM